MSDKKKDQSPAENEETEPQASQEQAESTPDESTASDQHKIDEKQTAADESAAEPTSDDNSSEDTETTAKNKQKESQGDFKKSSDDSIENQDGDDDYYEGYGEEYYMDSSLHTDVYADRDVKTEKEDDPELKANKQKTHNAGGDGGDGGDGDDGDDGDENENIPEGNPEKKMPFLEHLEELRWTLLRSIIAVVIGAIICFFLSEYIIAALKALAPPDKMTLVILGPTDGFVTVIKVALFSGLVLALPFVAYEFWKFVVPGLLSKEKKLVPPIVFFTVLCFLLGGAFAYFVILKFALSFLLGFLDQTENMIAVGKYLGFVVTIILVFGVVFELPVLSFFLTSIGLLTPEFLRNNRRYGIVIIFIMAALLTPPDLSTQLLLAGPLIILYEISIWVSAAVVRRKKEKDEEEDKD